MRAALRAAHDIEQADLRPTGPPAPLAGHAHAQQTLDSAARRALDHAGSDPADLESRWRALARRLQPRLLDDPTWPQLAARLDAADSAGAD